MCSVCGLCRLQTELLIPNVCPSVCQQQVDWSIDLEDGANFKELGDSPRQVSNDNGNKFSQSKSSDDLVCSPTPWLLNSTNSSKKHLPYVGLENNLEELLHVQAKRVGKYKTVSLVFFNIHQSVMMQNCVYSLVKFASVCNYIVVTWDEPTLKACKAMNMPCYNAESLIPGEGGIAVDKEARLHTIDYNKITWMKPIMVLEALKAGYAVHATDVDISYAVADLMESYMTYITEVGATAAFQIENKYPYVVNTGNYMVLPTKDGIRMMRAWVGKADQAIAEANHEQHALGELYHETNGSVFELCTSPSQCKAAAHLTKKHNPPASLVRRTGNAWWMVYGETCITKAPDRMYAAHPCSYPHLYFHSVCVIGSAPKILALKGAGFWFLDDGDDGFGCDADETDPIVVRCRPLVWRKPEVEEDFEKCDGKRLAFRYFQSNPSPFQEMISLLKTTSPPPILSSTPPTENKESNSET